MLNPRKRPPQDIPLDLRSTQRQALIMELRFSYRLGGLTFTGTGRTRNLGNRMICFEVDQDLHELCGRRINLELRIPWPFRLQNVCPLELVVRGPLVRKQGSVAVLSMESYEFETHGDRSFSQSGSRGVNCNLAA